MNPRGKHFIDAVDPEVGPASHAATADTGASQGSKATPVDEAQPVNPFETGETSASDAMGGADARAAAEGHDVDDASSKGDEVEWPSLDEAAPQRRRRSEKSIRRIKRKKRLKVLAIVLVVICAVAAAGVGYVNYSIAQGRAKFEKSTKKAIKTRGETITYNGKKYALNKHMATIAFIGFDNRATNDGT